MRELKLDGERFRQYFRLSRDLTYMTLSDIIFRRKIGLLTEENLLGVPPKKDWLFICLRAVSRSVIKAQFDDFFDDIFKVSIEPTTAICITADVHDTFK